MKIHDYNSQIASAIDHYLKDNSWHFHFDEERGIFDFMISLHSSVQFISYMVRVHEDSFLVSARYPLGPDADNEAQINSVMRFLTRANYGLKNGNFELDLNDGEINYKIFTNCADMDVSEDVIRDSIHIPSAMFRRYNPGLQDVIFRNIPADKAVEQCEDRSSRRLDKLEAMLSALKGKEPDNPEAEEPADSSDSSDRAEGFLKTLLERLKESVSDTSSEVPEEDSSDSSEMDPMDIFGEYSE